MPLILNLEARDIASTVKRGQYRKGSEKSKDDSSSDKEKTKDDDENDYYDRGRLSIGMTKICMMNK